MAIFKSYVKLPEGIMDYWLKRFLNRPSVPKFFERCPVPVHLELGASHVRRCGLWRAGGSVEICDHLEVMAFVGLTAEKWWFKTV